MNLDIHLTVDDSFAELAGFALALPAFETFSRNRRRR